MFTSVLYRAVYMLRKRIHFVLSPRARTLCIMFLLYYYTQGSMYCMCVLLCYIYLYSRLIVLYCCRKEAKEEEEMVMYFGMYIFVRAQGKAGLIVLSFSQ